MHFNYKKTMHFIKNKFQSQILNKLYIIMSIIKNNALFSEFHYFAALTCRFQSVYTFLPDLRTCAALATVNKINLFLGYFAVNKLSFNFDLNYRFLS